METKDELVEALIPIAKVKGKEYVHVAMELAKAKLAVTALKEKGDESAEAMCLLFATAITGTVDEQCKTAEERQELMKLADTILDVFFKDQAQEAVAEKLMKETIEGAKA